MYNFSHHFTLLLCLLVTFTSSFVFSTNRICKSKRQFYLRNKFAPVSEEKTITVCHNNKLLKKCQTVSLVKSDQIQNM